MYLRGVLLRFGVGVQGQARVPRSCCSFLNYRWRVKQGTGVLRESSRNSPYDDVGRDMGLGRAGVGLGSGPSHNLDPAVSTERWTSLV
jgi:hypothetical protein